MIGQTQVGNYFRPKHAGDIGSCGRSAPGGNFFGYATAPKNFPAFEHESGKARTREVSCRSQAIVTGSDHNGVVDIRGTGRNATMT